MPLLDEYYQYKDFLRKWILPQFSVGIIKNVEFDQIEISHPSDDDSLDPLTINGKKYILLGSDSFTRLEAEEYPHKWVRNYIKEYSKSDLERLPFRPTGAVPIAGDIDLFNRRKNGFVVTLEGNDLLAAFKEYMDPESYKNSVTKNRYINIHTSPYMDYFMLLN